MKYLLVAALVYMLLNNDTLKSMLSSKKENEKSKINDKPDEGEYVDYEEVD